MRILHVYKDYAPVLGGIENHMRDLAVSQARLGHDVAVLVTAEARHVGTAYEDGVRVVRVPRFAVVASTPLSTALFGALARERPDVTHLHFPYPVGEVAQLLRGRSRATVLTYHGDVVRQRGLLALYRPILLRVLDRADVVLATSEPYIRSSPYLQRVVDKTIAVPLGIATARFEAPDPAAVAAMRARFGAAGTTVFLAVGRLRYYKGLEFAIRAMAGVDGRLVIAGSGPMEREWRELARALGLSDRVAFLGEVEDALLPACYHAADVFVSSASHRSEAFGISILEAMACGRPVISTELGTGTSYVNQHESTGLVVPARDADALAGALRRLAADPAARARFGQAGRARVEQEFTLAVMTRRVLAAYARALGEG